MKKETYIRITSGTLAILMFIGGYVLKKTPEPNENFVAYENQTTTLPKDKDIKIDDTKELDEYLGYSHVTLEDVYEAIDANDNLSIEESNLTKHLAHGILEKYPNYDLRVYYENIKRGLFFEVLTKEEYDEKYPNCGIAHFNAKDRRISIIEGADDKTKYHELGHATWSFDWDIDGVRLRREENIDSFIEAMNNRLIEAVTDDKSYSAESASLDILSAFVPSFTIQEYSKTGLTNLIDNLIVEFGGKANIVLSHIQEITYKNRYGNSNISLKDHPVLIDELFDLILTHAKNNPIEGYDSLYNFFKSIPSELNDFQKYLEKYNEVLVSAGGAIKTPSDLVPLVAPFSKIDTFILLDGNIIPYGISTKLDSTDTIVTEKIDIDGFPTVEYDYELMIRLQDREIWPSVLSLIYLKYPDISPQELLNEAMRFFNSYNQVEFISDGKRIWAGDPGKVFISIGIADDGTRGFALYEDTSKEKLIYSSKDSLKILSSPIKFSFIQKFFPKNDGKIYISTILDDATLHDINEPTPLHSHLVEIDNVYLKDDSVKIVYPYRIVVEDNPYADINLVSSTVYSINDNKATLYPAMISFESPENLDPDDELSLYEILHQSGLLDDREWLNSHTSEEDKNTLFLTKEELCSYTEAYIDMIKPKTLKMTPLGQ